MTQQEINAANSVAFYKGFDAMKAQLDGMTIESARDKFNAENPIGMKYQTREAAAYARGEVDALIEAYDAGDKS